MTLEWKNVSSLILIYVALFTDTVTGIKTRSWNHYFGYKAFLQDRSFLTSPGQVYGYCDDATVEVFWNKFRLKCTFAMETTEAIDSPNHLRICEFSLVSHAANNETYSLNKISAINKDKAVLELEGIESYVIFILDFSDCKAVKANLDMGITRFKLFAPFEDMFDVVFQDSEDCPGHVCVTIVNTNGDIVTRSQTWIDDNSNIINVAYSPTKGRLVVDEYRNESWLARIYIAGNNYSIEVLKEYLVEEPNPNADYERIIASTTYNHLSACFKLDVNLTCTQFDLAGNLKFETTILLNRIARVHSLDVHNIPGGGFLLLVDGCLRNYSGVCSFKDRSFTVQKLDSKGQFIGSLKIERGFRAFLEYTHVFQSKQNELCLSNVHNPHDGFHKITLDIVCLKDDDFYVRIPWPNSVFA